MRIWLLGLITLLVVGCAGQPASGPPQGGLKIVCTTGMIGDLASRLAGSQGKVTTLMGPGVDPHLYKATASDVSALQGADVVFYNGLHLEGKMIEIFGSLASGRKVLGVADGIPKEQLRFIKAGDNYPDPHIWFDVKLFSTIIDPMTKTLVEADPAHRNDFEQRAVALKKELAELHGWCAQELNKIPKDRRILVTSHDAFGYFGRAYGIEVVALQGISTVSEASTSDVTKLVDYLKTRKIPAVFVESSVPRAIMERVSADAGVKIGGELFSDAMGPAGTEEGTYPGMVRHNVNLIVNGLK